MALNPPYTHCVGVCKVVGKVRELSPVVGVYV
jgi:hypothetical protein